ncbi:MAG: glycosyltransferase, partial [Chloroflexota bacterium]|nr:glycosyltransferase [Chloroflexota bacterium]
RPPRILLLSMYPLDRGMWGATTRITQLRDALARVAELDVVSGTRGARAGPLARRIGSLRRLDGIYVESSTTLPGPADLAFLALARTRHIPVLTYVPDAQQLFGEYDAAWTLKRRLARSAFLPALRTLMRLSTHVAFPSRGLARAIHGDDREVLLLPPGARLAAAVAPDPDARALLFVGPLNLPSHGADLLVGAVEEVRRRGAEVELISISRPGEELPGEGPPWLHRERADGPEIDRFLPRVMATITPRRKTPYNDLAVPIKVLEYLGYGRPLIVTDTEETTAIVREAGCGVITDDSVEGLAEGIHAVATASPEQRAAWGAAARRAAERNSWDDRARQIIGILQAS